MMKWLGLTGGIATGKSTVAEMIRQSGIPVVDADLLAHQALLSSSPVFAQIIQTFGKDILDSEGEIDRRKLGTQVFKSETLRKNLESLVHPYVKNQAKKMREDLEKNGHKIAFYDVPLLFEKNMQGDFDKVAVVWCDEDIQLSRLTKRNNLSVSEARDRLRAQLPLMQKMDQADYLIENNASPVELKVHVDLLLKKLNLDLK